jgi:hypothetical protein
MSDPAVNSILLQVRAPFSPLSHAARVVTVPVANPSRRRSRDATFALTSLFFSSFSACASPFRPRPRLVTAQLTLPQHHLIHHTLQVFPRHASPNDIKHPCPEGWSFKTNGSNQAYFMYHPTKKTSWQDPRFLPSGWQQHVNQDGSIEYTYKEREGGVVVYKTPVDPRGL